jgi:hypothetical protein
MDKVWKGVVVVLLTCCDGQVGSSTPGGLDGVVAGLGLGGPRWLPRWAQCFFRALLGPQEAGLHIFLCFSIPR